jgi:CHASE1-domain containing sensor protein
MNCSRPTNSLPMRYFAPTLGAVGLALSIGVWYLAVAAENRAIDKDFSALANNQLIILQNGVADSWEKLRAARSLFNSSDLDVTRDQFESFSNSLLDGHAAILNMSWIPRIKRDERVAHELAAARDGLADYHIRSITQSGSLGVIAPEKDEYYPKFFSTEARDSPVYGLDLMDGAMREKTLSRIRDGNIVSISSPLMLLIGEGEGLGFWAGLPVYARGLPHETVDERRMNLHGFVQAVFQIGVLIDTILADVKSPIRLYLFPPNAAPHDLPVYSKPASGPR